MRIFFIGTVDFSYAALLQLIQDGFNIVGVATKEQSQFNADHVNLAPICEEHGIPYKYVNDINHENNIAFMSSFAPDVVYCFGWSGLLKKEVLSVPRIGVVGFHPASLPANRGRHPIIWALSLGLSETASTFFLMDEGADSGDIISQEPIQIDYADDAQSLYRKIINVALHQIRSFSNQLRQEDKLSRLPQNHQEANYWRKRGKKDGQIDFRMTGDAIYNLVRALAKPYVGAHISLNDGEEVKVWRVEACKDSEDNIEPGKVLEVAGERILVKCSQGAVRLIEHEFITLPKVGQYL